MIDPIKWLDVANKRCPKFGGVTDWIDGTQAPVRVGYYERHFSDSPIIGFRSMQYWDGHYWRATEASQAHWRQVGDYPCWRGLTEEQVKLQGASMTPLAATEAERLEPCPFCQGTARIEDHRLSWSVHCNSCTACVLGERAPEPDGEMPDSYYAVFRQTAVTAWNRRASQQSAAQATAEPVAWALLNECDPEVTADPELADYWKRKGRSNFTSLYAGPSSATLEKIAFLEGHCEQMQKEFASIVGYNNKLLTELADYRGKQIIKPVTAPDRAPSTDSAAGKAEPVNVEQAPAAADPFIAWKAGRDAAATRRSFDPSPLDAYADAKSTSGGEA